MRIECVASFCCPKHGSPLSLSEATMADGEVVSGKLVSPEGCVYPIEHGVPNFVEPHLLTSLETQTQAQYDRVAEHIYDAMIDWQFAAMFETEGDVRETMVDMLGLAPGARVLEAGCGTGRDSLHLARRLDQGAHLHMQDLSSKMVYACMQNMTDQARKVPISCGLEYSISNATALPFPDETFDAVFHFGGFNQFGDLKRAAAELTRVARQGGRILIGDEAVAPWLKGTEFGRIVSTNNTLFNADAPLHTLPDCARDVTVRWIIGNCFYVISFRKGDGPPPLNLDLPHEGWRGGTMRTRYYGQLEGVTPDAKALAHKAASECGISVHEWLDRLVRRQAAQDLRSVKSEKVSKK